MVIKRIFNPNTVATIQFRIVPFVLCRCEMYSHVLGEKHSLSMFENKLLRESFGCEMGKRMDGWRNLHNVMVLFFTIH